MSKTKTKIKEPTLKTYAEMETAFGWHAAATLSLEALQLEKDTIVKEAEAKFLAKHGHQTGVHAAVITICEKDLHDWAVANEKEYFKEKRSLETTFGTLKFFRGQHAAKPKSKKWNWEKIVQRIKDCLLEKELLRVAEPEPNKEALIDGRDKIFRSEAGEFALEDLGVKIVQEETFTIEIKRSAPATQPMEVKI